MRYERRWKEQDRQEHAEAIARIHRQNPGVSREEALEILALEQAGGWLY